MFLNQWQFGNIFNVEEEQQQDQGEEEDITELVNKQYPQTVLERTGTVLIESDKKYRRKAQKFPTHEQIGGAGTENDKTQSQLKDKIERKELMIIRIAVQVEERKSANDRNDCCREGQKNKRVEIPIHDEWPSNETEGFNLYRSGTEPQERQGNHNVNKITGASPVNQFTDQALLAFLHAAKKQDIYKKYFGNWEQYKVMCKIGNQRYFIHVIPLYLIVQTKHSFQSPVVQTLHFPNVLSTGFLL